MNIVLTRLDTGDQGTFGRLDRWYTGELPWRDNATGMSCIPKGTYRVVWTYSPRFRKPTYRILGVAGRSGILIHSSNLMGDASLGWKAQLQGCISLGECLGVMDRQKALLLSRPAVRAFEDWLGRQPFTLEIQDA